MPKTAIPYFLFTILLVFLFMFGINHIPLWSSDEGRYGEIAREMWESKNFIVPHFNYIEYLEKPVLAPLLTALSYGLLGVSNLTTRLPGLLAGMAGILTAYFFTRRLFDKKTGEYAAIILTTSLGYVLVGRFAVIDMIMIFFLSLSLFCLMTACVEKKRSYYLLAYAAMGFTFLAKGLIGVVFPGLVFLSYLLWAKDLQEIKRMHLGWGILIVSAITLPWLLAISKPEPEFLKFFIMEHHFKRFATGSFGRSRPFWFFLPILIIVSFPWSFFLPSAIMTGLKKQESKHSLIKFLVCWITVIFVFLSIPKSKLPYYIIPLTTPIAVLVAFLLKKWSEKDQAENFGRLFAAVWKVLLILCGLAPLGLSIFLLVGPDVPELLMLKPIIPWAFLVLVTGGALGFFFYKTKRRESLFSSLAGVIYIELLITVVGMCLLSPMQSTQAFAATIAEKMENDSIVAVYSSPDHFSDLPFHLKKRVMIVSTDRGTLGRGSRELKNIKDAADWFLDPSRFVTLFNEKKQVFFCLLEKDDLVQLRNLGLAEPIVLRDEHGRILITNKE